MNHELGAMKEQILSLFKEALNNYENEVKGGVLGTGKYEEGLCFYFSRIVGLDLRRRTGEEWKYEFTGYVIERYKTERTKHTVFFFPPGHLRPRIELLKQIITDIEAGKHDDILVKEEVQP